MQAQLQLCSYHSASTLAFRLNPEATTEATNCLNDNFSRVWHPNVPHGTARVGGFERSESPVWFRDA